MTLRRGWVQSIVGLLSASALGAFAQTFPDKPIKLVVPFPAAGGADNLARSVMPRVGEILGQAIVIENRSGPGCLNSKPRLLSGGWAG